jgi:hypothetical protein
MFPLTGHILITAVGFSYVSGMIYMQACANGGWKRFVFAALLCAHGNMAALAYGQGGQEARFSRSDACIALPSTNRISRTWKHGEPEQRDYVRASTIKDARARIESLTEFSIHYPDSDYGNIALMITLGAEDEILDWEALAADSRKLLRSPTLDHITLLVGGYMQLAEALFHIKADEAAVRAKVQEVGWAVRCGREALQRRTVSGTSERVDTAASGAEFTFAMAQAQASLLGNEEADGLRESRAALQMKPSDYRANYLFALAMMRSESPDDPPRGIFYLARASSLSPSDDGLKKSVADVYRAYHGSDKGLDKLFQAAASNANPPSGFRIEQSHAKDHRAAKIAVGVAIAALLGYAIVKSPETFAAIGQAASSPAQTVSYRMLVFGGEDHKTYLGCLNCPKGAADSVLTPGGDQGPPNEGIWDKAGFGSPGSQSSACSVFASDPPVIVDEDGTYLGRLTLNRNHSQIGIGARFYNWLHDSVCN